MLDVDKVLSCRSVSVTFGAAIHMSLLTNLLRKLIPIFAYIIYFLFNVVILLDVVFNRFDMIHDCDRYLDIYSYVAMHVCVTR